MLVDAGIAVEEQPPLRARGAGALVDQLRMIGDPVARENRLRPAQVLEAGRGSDPGRLVDAGGARGRLLPLPVQKTMLVKEQGKYQQKLRKPKSNN